MARLKKSANIVPQKDGPEMRRTIWNHWRSGTTDLSMKLPKTWRIHNVFHASLLQRYKENNIYRTSYSRPPVELNDEGQEVYNVETILKHWRRGRGYQYYVKWEGYPITKASLEPEGSFSNNGNILNQYKQCHQLWIHQPRKLLLCYHWLTTWKNSIGTSKICSINSEMCTVCLMI